MKLLDSCLLVIGALSAAALPLANEDPFARDVLCAYVGWCPVSSHAGAWNKIIYDLAVGALITLLFYVLVVRLPDWQRRQRLKKSLSTQYRIFRKDCIHAMLGTLGSSYSVDTVDELMDQRAVKEFFQQKAEGRDDMDQFHVFQNNLDDWHLRELLTCMEIFREELVFVLNNTEIPGDRSFNFIK